MKNITLEDWLDYHPHFMTSPTDYYYTRLANKLYDEWRHSLLKDEMDAETRINISLRIAAYFEDVISGIGLWHTFIDKHKKITGKYLPFYDIDEENYFEDEINFPDVCFLIWSYMQRDQEETLLINPENPGIIDLAIRLYSVLDKEFEQAPINDTFLEYIKEKEHYTDFFSFKPLADWLFYDSYLLEMDSYSILDRETEIDNIGDISPSLIHYAVRSTILFNRKTGPLALTIQEWFSSWLQHIGMEQEAALISVIETCPNDYFRVNKKDETYYYTTNTQGNDYPILRSSFEEHADTNKDVIVSSLVKYDGEWGINGLAIWTDQKPYNERKEAWLRIETEKKLTNEKINKATDGYPLVYFKNWDELKEWLKNVLEAPETIDTQSFPQEQTPVVLFVQPGEDLFIMEDLPYCIKDERNPYYNQQQAGEMAMAVIKGNRQTTSGMIHFLMEKGMLPDARMNSLLSEKRGRELVQNNMEFMVRFYWLDKY